MKTKRLLLIDISNLFLRSFASNPTIGRNGEHIGALVGVFRSLQKIIREVNPHKITIVYDGEGGSKRRKNLNKNYKEGRNPIRTNRYTNYESEESEFANRIWQFSRMAEYFSLCPVYQLITDGVEADDIIAFVVHMKDYKEWQKVIVSADKDFIQLINEKTILFRPAQNEILNVKRVVEQYGIHPNNFCLARAMAGDKSDNIKGVSMVGLPTVSKRFPFICEEKQYYILDILEHSRKKKDTKIKAYVNILGAKKEIENNYKLMQLSSPSISFKGIQEIKSILKEELEFRKLDLLRLMIKDGCEDWAFEEMLSFFRKIILVNK